MPLPYRTITEHFVGAALCGRPRSFCDEVLMSKVSSIHKAREQKQKHDTPASNHPGFTPCSPDMTICGDCEGNRRVKKCPRLKEWLAKQQG